MVRSGPADLSRIPHPFLLAVMGLTSCRFGPLRTSPNGAMTRLFDQQYFHKKHGHWSVYAKFKGSEYNANRLETYR